MKGINRKLKSSRKMKFHFSHLWWAYPDCAVGEVFIMHSLSSSLDAVFQFGLEALCVRGSLTRVMDIISPSQMNTANTATETLHNQGPTYTLCLTHGKADRLNCTKEICFFPKTYPSQSKGKAMASQLLQGSLELVHPTCKAQDLHLWPWGILPPSVITTFNYLASRWTMSLSLGLHKVSNTWQKLYTVNTSWKKTGDKYHPTLPWTNHDVGTECCFMGSKIWVMEPYHILLSHPHTPRQHQMHRRIKQSDFMVRSIEVYGRIAFFILVFLSLGSKCCISDYYCTAKITGN